MKELLEYAAVRAVEGTASALPERIARLAGRGLGDLAGGVLGLRREHVADVLRTAFPGRPEEWIEGTARAAYRHFGRELVGTLRGGWVAPRRLAAESPGAAPAREWMERAVERHGGAIWVTGHVGNWELAGATTAALGFRVAAVVKSQRNRRVDRRLSEMRRSLGIEPIPMDRAARRIPRLLKEGWVVALVADQDAGRRGVFVPFLGRPASTFVGPARFALRCRVPLAFGTLVRDPETRPGYRGIFEPIGQADVSRGERGSPEREAAERALTRRWMGRLEAAVRRFPGQYFWFHRRWKTRPPGNAGTGETEGAGQGRVADAGMGAHGGSGAHRGTGAGEVG